MPLTSIRPPGSATLMHVALLCPDLDRSLRFYADGLGFRRTYHWSKTFDASGETVWKGHGVYIELDGMTYLELFESAAATDAGSESDHTAPAAMQHIGLIVPSVDDAYQACLAAGGETSAVGDWDGSPVGVTLNGDPETHVRVAFVQGPAGELIELYEQYSPVIAH